MLVGLLESSSSPRSKEAGGLPDTQLGGTPTLSTTPTDPEAWTGDCAAPLGARAHPRLTPDAHRCPVSTSACTSHTQ